MGQAKLLFPCAILRREGLMRRLRWKSVLWSPLHQLLWLFSAFEARSCRAACLRHPFASCCFNVPLILSVALRCILGGWEELRLAGCFCKNRGLSFNCPRLVVAFRPAYALRWSYHILATERWTAYGIWLRTSSWHTLKHTRDTNMRCFKDIATRAGQAEAEAAQYAQLVRFMHIPRQEFIGAKSDFDLLGVLVDIRQVMETVAVWHWGNS